MEVHSAQPGRLEPGTEASGRLAAWAPARMLWLLCTDEAVRLTVEDGVVVERWPHKLLAGMDAVSHRAEQRYIACIMCGSGMVASPAQHAPRQGCRGWLQLQPSRVYLCQGRE